MCQACTCGQVWAWSRVQVLQNRGSQMVVLRFTTLSARDSHWRNPRRKANYRECSNIKARVSQCQCTDGFSATQNGRGKWLLCQMEPLQRVSALIRNRTHVARQPRLTATLLNHRAIGSYRLPEKNVIWLVVFRHLQHWVTDFFAYRTVVLAF